MLKIGGVSTLRLQVWLRGCVMGKKLPKSTSIRLPDHQNHEVCIPCRQKEPGVQHNLLSAGFAPSNCPLLHDGTQ